MPSNYSVSSSFKLISLKPFQVKNLFPRQMWRSEFYSDPDNCLPNWVTSVPCVKRPAMMSLTSTFQKANQPLQSGQVTQLMDHPHHPPKNPCPACHMGTPQEEPLAEKSHMETMVSPYGLCTAGPTMQSHGLIWDELKTMRKRQHILPGVHSTLLFHLALWWRVLFLEGMLKHKNVSGVWLKSVFATASCQEDWIAEDQEKDGTASSHCLPLFTEQLYKVGFYAILWDRQERHLHLQRLQEESL